MRERSHRDIDRLFAYLLLGQWLFGVCIAAVMWPSVGERHVMVALAAGGVATGLPLTLIVWRPGWWLTRHVIAGTLAAWAVLVVFVTDRKTEAELDIFFSIACLALYRDWRVIATATIVDLVDLFVRGALWPDSVYLASDALSLAYLHHLGWLVFADVVVIFAVLRGDREMAQAAEREAKLESAVQTVEVRVKNRTRALKSHLDRYQALVENTAAIPFEYDAAAHRLRYVAPQIASMLGHPLEAMKRDELFDAFVEPEDRARVLAHLERFVAGDPTAGSIDYRMLSGYGQTLHVRLLLGALAEWPTMIRGIVLDVTPQVKLEVELRQAQKLESVGRLAAGVAHEINTPIQFVNDSIEFVRDAATDLMQVVARHESSTERVLAGEPSVDAAREAADASAAADLPYLREHVPAALERALDGIDRVATIVRSLKAFAHPDQGEMTAVDLNAAIQSTLTMARNEYKYVAELETAFAELPLVTCRIGEINQVVLNLVINAAHAIGGVVAGSDNRGVIRIATRQLDDGVEISIADTGGGIPEAIRDRIFDPFFTTKEVGKGTGQGLAIARSIVVDKHHGTMTFDSGSAGTTFRIVLPVARDAIQEAA